MIGKQLWICQKHRANESETCLSCSIAIDANISGEQCHCGEKATGYVAGSATLFYCDVHFDAGRELLYSSTCLNGS